MKREDLVLTIKCTELDNVIKAFKIANNAIYLNDKSNCLKVLYAICKTLNPEVDIKEIGKKYLEW